MHRALAVSFSLALLASCGSPKVGDACATSDGTGVCESSSVALVCEAGRLRAVPCKGAAGCIADSARFSCDLRAVAGDACPRSVEAQAQCDSADANSGLKCTSGAWRAEACKACRLQGGQIMCDPGCTAATCAGCCLNGACQPGNTAAACGKGAAACATCGTNQVCKAEQTCGVDPESTWTLQPTAASISTTIPGGGGTWDTMGGAPDPFVELWCPTSAAASTRTPTVQDTFNPTWSSGGCSAKARELLQSGFGVQVWDEDATTNDAITSKGTISVSEAALTEGRMILSTPDGGTLPSLTIQVQRQ